MRNMRRPTPLVVWLWLGAAVALAAQQQPSVKTEPLSGIIEVHAHSAPDSVDRPIDALALAKLARQSGMRALVLKNHNEPTASLATIVGKEVPGIQVFGGIALNRAVGGINPAAVQQMAGIRGGAGKVVWLPTADAENQVKFERANQEKFERTTRPFVSIMRDGQLLPETTEVLRIVAARGLVLATGHSAAAESLVVIQQARALGVQHIIVTHPLNPSIGMSLDQMREAAAQGAFLELCYGYPPGVDFGDYVRAVRELGPEHFILSSDSGSPTRPLHTDALRMFLVRMREAGFSDAALDLMMKANPARLLGLL